MLRNLEASPHHASFGRHVYALLAKRWNIQKRDKKAGCCQYLLPIILVAAGLGLLRIPPDFNFPTATLDATKYNQPDYLPVNSLVDAAFLTGIASREARPETVDLWADTTVSLSRGNDLLS